MMDIDTASNAELDQLAVQQDARQGERVLNAVEKYLSRFVAYPSPHALVAHTLWCAHAHMMDLWESTPRLAFLSPEPGSGKTRALEVTERLVPRPVATVNATSAYLFRKVSDPNGRPTLLCDEIDTIFGPKAGDHEDVRGMLNAGHRKGATAGRCVFRGQNVETEELPAYCAVALAGLGWLPDTILSRSVIIRMRKRHAGEKVEPYRERLNGPQGDPVRLGLEAWAATQREVCWPELPEQIQDRDADVWEALIAVADMAGGKWPTLAREAAVALVAESKRVEPSLNIRLLSDLKLVFVGHDVMATRGVLDALHKIEDAPWSDLKGKPLDARGLAHRLRQFGV